MAEETQTVQTGGGIDDQLKSLSVNDDQCDHDHEVEVEEGKNGQEGNDQQGRRSENGVEEGEGEGEGKKVERERSRKSNTSSYRFPVRDEAEECSFYMRTGMCKFGMACKFNHPPIVKKPQGGKVKEKGESATSGAQKVKEKDDSLFKGGPIDCKFFDRPGGCKYGKSCRFNHRQRTSLEVELNFMGLPVRQGELECPFYMRNGSCKFGADCKFNHPDPTSVGGAESLPSYSNGGSVVSSNTSQSIPAPWSPPAALSKSPPYVPLIYPPAPRVPPQPEWNAYQASVYAPERSMHLYSAYATNNQSLGRNMYSHQQQQQQQPLLIDEFPERPGHPECSYYMKTGNCKYRSACKFHHPKTAVAHSPPACSLSDLGLPLRPGESVCSYYNRYGICKYGPECKYDHPVNYVPSPSLVVSTVE